MDFTIFALDLPFNSIFQELSEVPSRSPSLWGALFRVSSLPGIGHSDATIWL